MVMLKCLEIGCLHSISVIQSHHHLMILSLKIHGGTDHFQAYKYQLLVHLIQHLVHHGRYHVVGRRLHVIIMWILQIFILNFTEKIQIIFCNQL
ncbi:hypothetical protein KSF78_0002778 [Schistosoma japonicum]|nr:hypothetical protein KSF78_0002778 [Schistosoma japonicum]KAH8863702.1 hypothetical protein KSF78_0002778 [Schistosoma japonicum]